jgi:hypothetical protein
MDRSPNGLENALRRSGCGLLTGPGTRETLVSFAYAKVDLDQVGDGTRAAGGESRGGRSIRSIGRVAELSGECGECGCVRSQFPDLERNRSSALEFLLEGEAPPRRVALPGAGVAERRKSCLPRFGVRACELRRAIPDGDRLRCDAGSVLPRVVRAARDHRDEARREGDRERGRRPAARRPASLSELVEECVEP